MRSTKGILESAPVCPSCGSINDGWTAMEAGTSPSPDDVCVCCYCSEVLQYTEDMQFKVASVDVIIACGLLEVSRTQIAAKMLKANLDWSKNRK